MTPGTIETKIKELKADKSTGVAGISPQLLEIGEINMQVRGYGSVERVWFSGGGVGQGEEVS